MTFITYLKSNLGEAVLLVLSAWAVSCVGVHAFFLDTIAEAFGYFGRAGIALVLCAVLIFALYFAAWRRRQIVIGIVVYVAVCAVLVGAALALSGGENPYEDVEGNFFYFAVLVIACCTAAFLLTRTLAGSVVWFVAVAFSCSLVEGFYQSGELAMSVVAALLGLALIVHKNVRVGLENADVAKGPSEAGSVAMSASPAIFVGLIALAVWFLVIAPLNPGVAKITLITDYKQLPIEELRGTAQEHPTLNFDMTTQNLTDGFYYTTDDLVEDPTSSVTIDAASMLEQQLEQEVQDSGAGSGSGGGEREGFSEEANEEVYDTVSYTQTFPVIIVAIIVVALIIAAIVAYFIIRRRLRMKRLLGYLDMPMRQQIENIYAFLLERMERIGLGVPTGSTLGEFMGSSVKQMSVLDDETCVEFAQLTRMYEACAYGHVEPTEDDVVPFAAYYLNFWKAARAHLGTFKYFFKSFRL